MDAEITLMDAMVPAFTAMHENGGHLPTECIFLFAHQFSSDMFTGIYNVPSYTIWKSGVDQTPAYEWHRRMLQTLQWAPTSDGGATPSWVRQGAVASGSAATWCSPPIPMPGSS